MQNREIKFRAWFPPENRFVVTEFEPGDGDDGYVCSSNSNQPIYANQLCWQQFTGKRDIYGTPIYEGDILRIRNHRMFEKVVFLDGCFGVHFNYDSGVRADGRIKDDVVEGFEVLIDMDGLEVVGNVFENGDLL